jgi:arylsulfatase
MVAMWSAAFLLLAAVSAVQAPDANGARADRLLVRFTAAAVDGVDELVVKDGRATIEHRQWQPIQGLAVEVLAPAPEAEATRIMVRAHIGRSRVSVIETPSAANGRVLRVRIDDGADPGAAPLAFELWAVPVEPTPHPFDVVVITIDSLRPDHLGSYGYARATSPNLDAFAKSGVRCTNAFSTSSFTPPSHASLLTSRYVGDHGVLTWNPLDESQLTLAEILDAHGYRTGASVNLGLLSEQNLGQGFQWRREGNREAREIVSDGLNFLREADDRPCFLWLHLYDVHRPYGRIPGWTDRFAASVRARIGDEEDHYNLRPEEVTERKLTAEDLAYIADRYDAGIAYADAQLGPLLAELSSPRRLARTLVVITADHGESLLDHPTRLFSHDPFLYASVTHVPLLVRFPGGFGAGSVRADLTSLIDVAPTVCATLGIAAPPTFAGRSLRDLEEGVKWPERELYQECWGWSRLAALRTRDVFVLRDVKGSMTRVFALGADPLEALPLDPTTRPETVALAQKLEVFAARRPKDEAAPPLDPDVMRRLRSLGYTDR